MSENIIEIPGPAGLIEARYGTVEGTDTAALICHPHPLYGGSRHDAVVARLCNAAKAVNMSSLALNFRGVGRSEGQHDKGVSEVDDVVFLLQWLLDQPNIKNLVLGGYSFGGGVALKAATLLDKPLQHLVLVAPAILGSMESATLECPLTVITGSQDNIIETGSVQNWLGSNAPHGELIEVDGADHFFIGMHDQIESIVKARLG